MSLGPTRWCSRTDGAHWVVTNRLEGDSPGGGVDLRYHFAMDGDLVPELVIAR